MQISSVAGNRTIPLTSIVQGSSGSGRVSLPVPRSQALYARFKHVSGRPSPNGGGHPLYKLRSLDTLIDRLVTMKDKKAVGLSTENELGQLSPEKIDTMIAVLSDRLHNAYKKAEINPYISPGNSLGIIADITL